MKKIYIILTQSGTLFSKTIRFFTGKPYNHASIGLNESLDEFYSFGRKVPTNPLLQVLSQSIKIRVFLKFLRSRHL